MCTNMREVACVMMVLIAGVCAKMSDNRQNVRARLPANALVHICAKLKLN